MSVVEEGSTQSDAAGRFGVTRAAVQYWVSKVRRERAVATPELLPVVLASAAPRSVELEFGGVTVRVPGDVAPAYVAELVRALRSC